MVELVEPIELGVTQDFLRKHIETRRKKLAVGG